MQEKIISQEKWIIYEGKKDPAYIQDEVKNIKVLLNEYENSIGLKKMSLIIFYYLY